MLKKLWNDEQGTVAMEYLLVATLIGLALIVGINTVGRALNAELIELGQAIVEVNQSYSYSTFNTCAGSAGAGQVTDAAGEFTTGLTTPTNDNIGLGTCDGVTP